MFYRRRSVRFSAYSVLTVIYALIHCQCLNVHCYLFITLLIYGLAVF